MGAQVDKVAADVQRIVESQLNQRGNNAETLGPFRQQAATVMRNKEMAAEQLDQCSKELRDVEHQIRDKQHMLDETVGGTILRGDELKEYVNKLRAKSSIYKQQRAELAALKVYILILIKYTKTVKTRVYAGRINRFG